MNYYELIEQFFLKWNGYLTNIRKVKHSNTNKIAPYTNDDNIYNKCNIAPKIYISF